MIEKIIIAAVAVLMLFLTIQKRDKWTISLTSGLTLGILITWAEIPILTTIGMTIYTITAFLSMIYGFRTMGLEKLDRIVIGLAGLWAITANVFSFMHWAYVDVVKWSMLIPLTGYLVIVTRGLLHKKELGFLTILNMEFLIRFLRIWV